MKKSHEWIRVVAGETYYYVASFDLLVNVSVQVLIANEVREIYAGSTFLNKNYLTARLLQ